MVENKFCQTDIDKIIAELRSNEWFVGLQKVGSLTAATTHLKNKYNITDSTDVSTIITAVFAGRHK